MTDEFEKINFDEMFEQTLVRDHMENPTPDKAAELLELAAAAASSKSSAALSGVGFSMWSLTNVCSNISSKFIFSNSSVIFVYHFHLLSIAFDFIKVVAPICHHWNPVFNVCCSVVGLP